MGTHTHTSTLALTRSHAKSIELTLLGSVRIDSTCLNANRLETSLLVIRIVVETNCHIENEWQTINIFNIVKTESFYAPKSSIIFLVVCLLPATTFPIRACIT